MLGDEVVVTATRFRERFVDKPVNVVVVTADDIKASTAKTVPELLSEQAGIALHDFFGNNAASTLVDLRGLSLPAWVYGGNGNDKLFGGGGDDVIVGGDCRR